MVPLSPTLFTTLIAGARRIYPSALTRCAPVPNAMILWVGLNPLPAARLIFDMRPLPDLIT